MFFTDTTDLPLLNFKPLGWYFKAVRVEWGGWVLNGQENFSEPVVSLSDRPLCGVLAEIFPNLSFVELCQLIDALEAVRLGGFSRNELLKAYAYHPSERMDQLMSTVRALPLSVQFWAGEKKASPQDLMPLIGCHPPLPDEVWHLWCVLSPSRSEGKQLLDLLVDLHLQGKLPSHELRPTNSEDWIKQLKELRYPIQSLRDRQDLTQGGWPRFVKVKGQRQGDHLSFEMRIDFINRKDLADKLQRLQNLALSEEPRPPMGPTSPAKHRELS